MKVMCLSADTSMVSLCALHATFYHRKSNLLKFEASNIRLLVIRDTEQGIKKLFDSQIQYDGTVSLLTVCMCQCVCVCVCVCRHVCMFSP